MIRHLLKLIWKQRRLNAWIAAELFLVFLLLAYIMDYFITIGYASLMKNPYDIKDTYQVMLAVLPESSSKYIHYDEADRQQQVVADYLTVVDRIRQHPLVEQVSLSNMSVPYTGNYRSMPMGKDTASVHYCQMLEVSPSFFEVFRIYSRDGESPSDLANVFTDKSMIISRRMAEMHFPNREAKGQTINTYSEGKQEQYRVAAVLGTVKRDDYSREEAAAYIPLTPSAISGMNEQTLKSLDICIRVKPGMNSSEFKEKFLREMQQQLLVGNFLLYQITSFEEFRTTRYLVNGQTDAIRYRVSFMVFLLMNIFLGIVGTFWLRNEGRKSEIGLRMAVGSTRKQVLGMMIGEGWLLLTVVAVPAIILCVNLVKMEFVSTNIMGVTFLRVFSGLLLTYVFMALVIMLGAWYPAYLSSRIAPADTLRNE